MYRELAENGTGGLITAASGNLLWRLHRSLQSAGWCEFLLWVGLGGVQGGVGIHIDHYNWYWLVGLTLCVYMN